ncbi:MAG TPA: four helix bundle protein [Flavisolibacter sp.]
MSYIDFTEMPVWQDANKVILQVYSVCSGLPKSEDYALSSQLKRAALSIAANIAEAFGRTHTKDKVNFYTYARGSVFEVRNHLIIGRDLSFLNESDVNRIDLLCREIIFSLNKIIKGLLST